MDISLSNIVVKIGPEQKTLFKIREFEIKAGEKILITGASGSGKTTLLHLLAGLFSPFEGRVQFGDVQLNRLSEEQRSIFRRKNISLVFQKLNLIEHLTAKENIELSVQGKKRKIVISEALSAVGLSGRENDRTQVLSLGEQQRVAIARVLVAESDFIFADEPTSSLDESNAIRVIELLLKACQTKTLIVVSHDRRIENYFSKKLNFKEIAE